MGKTIEKMALQKGHTIVAKIDYDDDWKHLKNEVKQADVAIEFSTPQTVVKNMFRCFDLNIPIVVGTTGWNEQKEGVFSYCKHHQKALFHASNFSIGMNLFFELNKHLAQMMKNFPDYNVHIEETHHLQKLDKPSGTAISLVEDLLPHYPLEISNITSIREDEVFGIHKIRYESAEDTIEIKHEAKSREGFAKGAVCAAEWLIGKIGVFTMSDMLNCKGNPCGCPIGAVIKPASTRTKK